MPQVKSLYGTMARYYDQIYHWKDYKAEVIRINGLIERYKRSSGNELLDVACGTGKHLMHLKYNFNCMGVDASKQMLSVARKNVPGMKFKRGSMVSFDLGRQFDVVLCLFSSFGYRTTKREIRSAINNFAIHLKSGGLLILEPWIRRSKWRNRLADMQTYDSDSLKIARVNYGRALGKLSILDDRYLIAEKGKGIVYVRDIHRMRFFDPHYTLLEMRHAGLTPRFTEYSLMPGRGLVIATKR